MSFAYRRSLDDNGLTSLAWAVLTSPALFQLLQSVAPVSGYKASLVMSTLDSLDPLTPKRSQTPLLPPSAVIEAWNNTPPPGAWPQVALAPF